MFPVPRSLNKPEYFYNHKQLFLRLKMLVNTKPKGQVSIPLFKNVFTYSCADDIGRALHAFGLYDLCVSEALWRLVTQDSTVLDIGANIGYFSALCSYKVGSKGKIYAFEPNPQILPTLKVNTRSLENVRIMPWALSNKDGMQSLYGPQSYSENKGLASLLGQAGEEIAHVDLKRLDDLKLSPKLIKMDVEGHELQVLEGGVKTLATVENIIFEEHNLQKSGVKDFLMNKGFQIYYLQKNFKFLSVVSINSSYTINPYEPPNFLATKYTEQEIAQIFSGDRWKFLDEFQRL